ncbi:hypothetical protein K1T71_011990 [Dendrolimus kikuchii]|uniref:Uncharacterized protein n=1 Tax=Dendrolimus kikuchii TaxID=765133 RepID=A0ACC1CKK2_9NEOP|nr:hypothetical protein K1T71_011990 [Dendrolimus kikuchii]
MSLAKGILMESRRRVRLTTTITDLKPLDSGIPYGIVSTLSRPLHDLQSEKEAGSSPALREALDTIRAAWPEPTTLFDRTGPVRRTPQNTEAPSGGMVRVAQLATAPGASPGLLRRRYSVPETIMRKYSLAQQKTESEEVAPIARRSPASASLLRDSPGESPHRFARRDRELMRKSALLRRLWGRGPPPCCHCADASDAEASWCRETRSLDGSRSELRPLFGWANPKRQRLESAHSPCRGDSPCAEATPDPYTDASEFHEHDGMRAVVVPSEVRVSSATTLDVGSDFADEGSARLSGFAPPCPETESSYGNLTDSFTMSISSTKPNDRFVQQNRKGEDFLNDHIHGRAGGRSARVDVHADAIPYDTPLSIETPSYEVLEIVVSETLNALPSSATDHPKRSMPMMLKAPLPNHRYKPNFNIDEYVSNILVESLNSLSDQLECMNASIGSDRKVSIVEKEIKVKLQNTGVNTIVHLSPTSNNQIIFGNEELCNREDRDACNNPREARDSITIREELHSVASNNNLTSAGSGRLQDVAAHGGVGDTFATVVQHEAVNQAVLQQIQKLFRDELHNTDCNIEHSGDGVPSISHIEISNVDVYIDNNAEAGLGSVDALEVHTSREGAQPDTMAGVAVGAGNYARTDQHVLVPRFSAFPHTDSMEVNTSSSDDAEVVGSDCTSLVDSLDDPNSPRSVLLRRSFNGRRSELVRSAIDVLDLLPESASLEENTPTKDKGESFFIRIKDDDYDCEKENINVADHMPEKIKERLYRRQKKRELRMECARRSKVKQGKRDIDKKRSGEKSTSKRHIERECMAIINALIDDVIAKITQDEYTCMRIKKRPTKLAINKIDESTAKKHRPSGLDCLKVTPKSDVSPLRTAGNGVFKSNNHNVIRDSRKPIRHQIHGKLSLVTRPSPVTDNDREPKRIYQKSEIQEGNKFIEILEILEYVNGSRSSTETSPSDENHNYHQKNKKSRIPVPVHDKINKTIKIESSTCNSSSGSNGQISEAVSRDKEARIPKTVTSPQGTGDAVKEGLGGADKQGPAEPRVRRSSLGFKRSFDVIPEEKTSLSMETSDEEQELSDPRSTMATEKETCKSKETLDNSTFPVRRKMDKEAGKGKICRSVGTSPMSRADVIYSAHQSRNRSTMTSPSAKSASTSPFCASPPERYARDPTAAPRPEGTALVARRAPKQPPKAITDARKPEYRKSMKTQQVESPARHKQPESRSGRAVVHTRRQRPDEERPRIFRSGSVDGHEHERVKLPECKGSSSDSGDSAGGLLCSLAPKWLSAHSRHRRNARRRGVNARGWSVTVAGSCRAALPADVEMRLRFPHESRSRTHDSSGHYQECSCRPCAACACSVRAEHAARPRRAPPLPATPHLQPPDSKLTLTMKKEALDSSILASRSTKKSTVPLPEVETYAAASSKLRSSVKTRRGYSLHCWLPDADLAPIRPSKGLSVLGCAIVPELKPRVPTMSERDLTRARARTPRHYLRS